MRQKFSDTKTLEQAKALISSAISRSVLSDLGSETVSVTEALKRITAKAVFARYSSPFYHSSAMDGYAVRFVDTLNASERQPLHLKVGTQAIYVDTGDPLPVGFDSVVMIEDVNLIGDKIEIYKPASPYQHVRVIGEDIVATELIVPENHLLSPIDLSAIAASGIYEVEVRRQPKVTVIPTGTEIVPLERVRHRPPQPPEIIEYNSIFIKGLLEEVGSIVLVSEVVKDDKELIKEALSSALKNSDVALLIAGSGKGSEDYTAQVIEESGELIIQGVSIKPGKPFLFGLVEGKPVFGIPGYPVSAYICVYLFVLPLIKRLLGIRGDSDKPIKAVLSRQIPSQLGVDEFLRVKLGSIGDKLIATPIGRGAGLIMSLVRADGLLQIPAKSEGYTAGSEVEIIPLKPMSSVHNTVVCIGSHDNTLDLLSNFLSKRYTGYQLSSAHVGSMGGLMALKRGECHIAGTHLLDEQTGEYNIPYIERLFSKGEVTLINLVYRQQGFVVAKGNPKGIRGFDDLCRNDIMYINRQAGSGTRVLFDKHLRELGISPADIKGYDREEYTHLSVASAVLTGIADTGLAVLSAAMALGLDFIPVAKERYDLAIRTDFLDSDTIKALLFIIRQDKEFREAVLAMGGYDIEDMGKVIY